MSERLNMFSEASETLQELLARCRIILEKSRSKDARRSAYWADRQLSRFIERKAKALEDRDWMLPRSIWFSIAVGGNPSEFSDPDQCEFAELLALQAKLIAKITEHEDPHGTSLMEAWPRNSNRGRPRSNGYTLKVSRGWACLISKEINGYSSFNRCWEAFGVSGSPPKIPVDGEKAMLPGTAAMIILGLTSAKWPLDIFADELSLLAAQRNARRALADFGLSVERLQHFLCNEHHP